MFVRLFRDSFETPWGFRLQGGKDIGHALTVQRVFSNSPAEGELQRGDVILSINGRDANTFTHKQALDTIKFGGGQIELKVNRPAPGSFSIKTIQPSSPTRAPQISPIKTSPLKFPVRRASDHSPRDMPPPAVAGFQPKKITMNKFGGGTTSFGSTYGARAQQPGWVPQPSPYSEQYTPQPSMQEQYGSNYNQQYQPQQYQPPSPQYQAPPPQFQPPSPQPEPYLPKYQSPGLSQPDYVRSEDPVDEEEYDYVPVSQRKQQFAEKKGAPAAIKSRKAKPFVPHGGGGQSFGTDYSKTRPHPPPQPPVVQQRPRPPPVTQRPVNAAPCSTGHIRPTGHF
ncbi:hypothetical protein FSP39_003047 [Pinctada imbricata]|uniref:PDZ domain-containing protein n=1 Tax=Pinctada imbricata TaxID=66713 RepID=A0AA89BSD8_PINIB|nr:hypothetical protein FSP39_003047 [Pinctada imbricata]